MFPPQEDMFPPQILMWVAKPGLYNTKASSCYPSPLNKISGYNGYMHKRYMHKHKSEAVCCLFTNIQGFDIRAILRTMKI